MVTDLPATPPDEHRVALVSERKFGNVVRRYGGDPGGTAGAEGVVRYPFDDPLFDFIITCRSDEAAYETAPEIARGHRGVDFPERKAIEQLMDPLDPRARERAEQYMRLWGYGTGVAETVRALIDLVRSRVSRGACAASVGMCWIAHQAGLSADLQPFLESWRSWKGASIHQRKNIEKQFVHALVAT